VQADSASRPCLFQSF